MSRRIRDRRWPGHSTHRVACVAGCALTISAHSIASAAAQSTDPPAAEPAQPSTAATDADTQASEVTEAASSSDPLPPTTIDSELSRTRPGVAIKRELDRIAEETNIRFGIAHTLLFQQASGGPGQRTAAGGDLDLLAKWTAIGKGTKDTGVLAFAAEYRYQIGDQAPAALSGEIGTLTGTTNGFGERTMTVKECYWDQRLFEDRFRFVVGRIDPENLFGGHRLQSANFYFLNKAFSSNPTIAFPGPGMAVAAQLKPVPWLYLDGGITDANGRATVANFEGFFSEHEYLFFSELALTPTIEGLGHGRYRVALWQIDARTDAGAESDAGITVSLDQDLGETLTVFARYGNADGDATGVTNAIQGGFGLKGVLGKENMLGLAGAWTEPTDDDLRDEKIIEVFQRFQVTEVMQFMVGAQVIFDPSRAPDDDLLAVFSARLRVSF